jgi:hypothetical protein
MTTESNPEEDHVPVSLCLQRFDGEVRICLDPPGELSPDGVDPAMDGGIGVLAGDVVFRVFGEEPQPVSFSPALKRA